MSEKSMKKEEQPQTTINELITNMHQIVNSVPMKAYEREGLLAGINGAVSNINLDKEYKGEDLEVEREEAMVLIGNISVNHADYAYLKSGFAHLYEILNKLGAENNGSNTDKK